MEKQVILNFIKNGLALRRLQKDGKQPAFKGHFDTGDSLSDLIKWDGNIGIMTGYLSGVVCLDLDVHDENANGIDNLKKYIKEHNLPLPVTRTIKSPTGGIHMYYRLPKEYNNKAFAPNLDDILGLDFRNHRQYMVAEGSVTEKGMYTVIRDVLWDELPTCPEWILNLYSKKDEGSGFTLDSRTFFANKLSEFMQGTSTNRNNWLTSRALFLYSQNMTKEEVFNFLGIININVIEPPLEMEEFKLILDSTYRYHVRKTAQRKAKQEKGNN